MRKLIIPRPILLEFVEKRMFQGGPCFKAVQPLYAHECNKSSGHLYLMSVIVCPVPYWHFGEFIICSESFTGPFTRSSLLLSVSKIVEGGTLPCY